jgi:hypothetical protein
MKEPLIFSVARDLALDGLQIREGVAVRQHHAARLGSGARGKDDFESVAALQTGRIIRPHRPRADSLHKFLEDHASDPHIRQFARDHRQFRRGFGDHAAGKFRRGDRVHGHDHGPAQQATDENRQPIRSIRAPQKYAVAAHDAANLELAGELRGHAREFAPRPALHAVALLPGDGDLPRGANAWMKVTGQRIVGHAARSFPHYCCNWKGLRAIRRQNKKTRRQAVARRRS